MADSGTKEKLDRMRSNLASTQSINVESEGLDPRTIDKLYWAIEDALTQVKYLQESLEDEKAEKVEEKQEELLVRCETCGDRIAKGEPCSCDEEVF